MMRPTSAVTQHVGSRDGVPVTQKGLVCAWVRAEGWLKIRYGRGFRARRRAPKTQPSWVRSHLIVLPRKLLGTHGSGTAAKKGTYEHSEPRTIQRKRQAHPAPLYRRRTRGTP